jgi:hypothetical protein
VECLAIAPAGVHSSAMSKSIRDQMLGQGVVQPEDTAEAKWAAAQAAAPAEPEKRLPPPFEAPARGVIVRSSRADKDRGGRG